MSAVEQKIADISGRKTQPAEHIRLHLDYLDGLRGLAAFYVMISHVAGFAAAAHLSTLEKAGTVSSLLLNSLMYGREAVAVFIVLSGFCLMLPVARSCDGRLAGGLRGFARRRARRILPPYYAALALSIIVLLLALRLHNYAGERKPDLSAFDISQHVVLVHNLFPEFSRTIDAPMWSVAAECQIYVLFALLLLPAWRRLGIFWTTLLAFAVGLAPIVLLPAGSNLYWTCPWYLGLFALGMAMAVVMCSGLDQYRVFKSPFWQNAALLALLVAGAVRGKSDNWIHKDMLIGPFAAIFILACGNKANQNRLAAALVRILESRPMMVLGAFSYSLYLIHFVLLGKLHGVVSRHHVSYACEFAILLFVGVPLTLLASYLFHLIFERPFMPGHPKTERQAELAAIASPAP